MEKLTGVYLILVCCPTREIYRRDACKKSSRYLSIVFMNDRAHVKPGCQWVLDMDIVCHRLGKKI